jgi:hypothetical protein
MTFEIDFIQRAETPQSDKLDNNVKANYVPPRNIKIFDFLDFGIIKSIPKDYCCIFPY